MREIVLFRATHTKLAMPECKHVYVCCYVDDNIKNLITTSPDTMFYININPYNLQLEGGDDPRDANKPIWKELMFLSAKNNCKMVNPSSFPLPEVPGEDAYVTALKSTPKLYDAIETRFPWLKQNTTDLQFARKKWFDIKADNYNVPFRGENKNKLCLFWDKQYPHEFWQTNTFEPSLDVFQKTFEDEIRQDEGLRNTFEAMRNLEREFWKLKDDPNGVNKWISFCSENPHPDSRVNARDAQKMFGVIKRGFAKLDNDLLGLAFVEHCNFVEYPKPDEIQRETVRNNDFTNANRFQQKLAELLESGSIRTPVDGLIVDLEADDYATVAYALAKNMNLKCVIVQRGQSEEYNDFRHTLKPFNIPSGVQIMETVVSMKKLPNFDKVKHAISQVQELSKSQVDDISVKLIGWSKPMCSIM